MIDWTSNKTKIRQHPRLPIKQASTGVILMAILLLLTGQLMAKTLGTMSVTKIPDEETIPRVVRHPDQAVLLVWSQIRGLSFETNNKSVIAVNDSIPGVFAVHLHPGTHRITFKATDFNAQTKTFLLPKKTSQEVIVELVELAEPELPPVVEEVVIPDLPRGWSIGGGVIVRAQSTRHLCLKAQVIGLFTAEENGPYGGNQLSLVIGYTPSPWKDRVRESN